MGTRKDARWMRAYDNAEGAAPGLFATIQAAPGYEVLQHLLAHAERELDSYPQHIIDQLAKRWNEGSE